MSDSHEARINYFSFNLDKIIQDKVVDTAGVQSTLVSYYTSGGVLYNSNPDNYNSFNYGWEYSWNDSNPGNFLTSVALAGFTMSPISYGSCDSACSICFNSGNSNCLACNAGFVLIGNSCKSNSPSPFYYFKSPPTIPPATKLSLNITSLNLSNYPGLTIFLYLKIYGFLSTAVNKNIITFGTNFDIYSDPTSYGISLRYNGILQFNYANLQQEYFGKWIPISLAMFRSPNVALSPNMNSMSILYTNLARLVSSMSSYSVTELSISSSFIGLVSDINIYRSFIVNAYGFASQ